MRMFYFVHLEHMYLFYTLKNNELRENKWKISQNIHNRNDSIYTYELRT